MYTSILLPVDMAHIDRLDKSLKTAADLAKHYGIPVTYVGVTMTQPSAIAHSPEEFKAKLEVFASEQAAAHGHRTAARSYVSHDLSVDLNKTLVQAVQDIGADLVVMAAYVPTLADHLRRSHESAIVAQSGVSVFVVR